VLTVVSALAVLVGAVPATPAGASSTTDRTKTLLVVQSRAIPEDSALARSHGLFVTTNDGGDTGRVFVLDRRGHTVGVTRWARHPRDCEALAPGAPGHVWVGDIGDNHRRRAAISVSRVPVGRGHRAVHVPRYRLVYPDGPADAETLVRNPATGRLYVATKSVTGGTLYAVPRHPSRRHTNQLARVAPVLPIATDGAFLPGGDFLVLRSYTTGVLYRWPSMATVGSFPLPRQRQGEGLAAGAEGVLFLSSEGVRQPILRMRLPTALRRIVAADDRPRGSLPGA
jgi:hypothetical protein